MESKVNYFLLGCNAAMAWATYRMDMPAFAAINAMCCAVLVVMIYWSERDA